LPHAERNRLAPLTEDLRALLRRAEGRSVGVAEIADTLGERGTAALTVLLAAPFVQPIPLPGLSLPFGIAIAALGVRLTRGKSIWLPSFLLPRQLQPATLAAMVRVAEKLAGPVERRLRPAWSPLVSRAGHLAAGTAIAVAAITILPPIPIPGFNAVPALAIVLLALGLMESDGRAVAAGYAVLLGAFGYFYLWWSVAVRMLEQVIGLFT
jgi:hypothetical protein